jgi:hypothetical protein
LLQYKDVLSKKWKQQGCSSGQKVVLQPEDSKRGCGDFSGKDLAGESVTGQTTNACREKQTYGKEQHWMKKCECTKQDVNDWLIKANRRRSQQNQTRTNLCRGERKCARKGCLHK